MDEMSKSPEEIKNFETKKELAYVAFGKVSYEGCHKIAAKALAYIQQLESNDSQVQKALQDNGFQTLEELLQAFSQVKRERDAAIRDCARFPCYTCKERENGDFCPQCRTTGTFRILHEWRGPCEENGGLPEPPKEDT